jgi:phosphatidylglycerol:prolipoprotein diacylglycerol transferase
VRQHVVDWLAQYVRIDVAELVAPSWFTCVGLAGLVSLILMLALARRRGIAPGVVASVVLWGYVAAVAAGIVMPMLIDCVEHLVTTGRFHLKWSGMTSFWGYLAGALAVVLVCKRERVPLARFADMAIVPLGFALVFARLGCFMAGCDYGKVTNLPWAVRFPSGSPAWHDQVHAGLIPADRIDSLPVHPTQLYEAALGLVIVAVALLAARRWRKEGNVFLIGAATYAVGRFAIETLRGDAGRGIYAGLSSGQIFSLLVLGAIALRFVAIRRRPVTAFAVTALALLVAGAGEAHAQLPRELPPLAPSQPAGPPPQPDAPPANDQETPPDQPPYEVQPAPVIIPEQPAIATAPVAYDPTERPLFSTGVLAGIATPLNRRSNQVPTLAGLSASIGWMPGRFGVWVDLDRFSNSDATHTTMLAAFSYTFRPNRQLMLGVRTGLGLTLVNFQDPAFRDVAGKTVRLEAIAEYAFTRHFALWVRPLSIDMLQASELGGPITTYQVRVGFAYRFGSRHNARPAAPQPPPTPIPPPPAYPTLDPDPPPPTAALEGTP